MHAIELYCISADEKISWVRSQALRYHNYTEPVEYYKEKYSQYYVCGRLALVYCVLQSGFGHFLKFLTQLFRYSHCNERSLQIGKEGSQI